jgi:hypothetical protein
MEEKKASEVLGEIQAQVTEILLTVKNIQFLYQVLLNRVNELPAKLNASPQLTSKTEKILEVAVEAPPVAKAPEAKVEKITKQNKERLVRQKVLYPESVKDARREVVLATVRLYREDIKSHNKDEVLLANNIRTDMKGYWNHKLAPGTYYLHIVKKPQANKPMIDYYHQIQIPEGTEVFELPTVSANG